MTDPVKVIHLSPYAVRRQDQAYLQGFSDGRAIERHFGDQFVNPNKLVPEQTQWDEAEAECGSAAGWGLALALLVSLASWLFALCVVWLIFAPEREFPPPEPRNAVLPSAPTAAPEGRAAPVLRGGLAR